MLFLTKVVLLKKILVFLVKKELSLIIFLFITQYLSILRKSFILLQFFYIMS